MPDYIIQNPYASLPDEEKKNSSVRLSVRDIAYLNTVYPMLVGKLDKVLSNLFSNFINELRRYEPESAFFADHPSYTLLRELLQLPVGGNPVRSSPCPPDDSGAAPLLHPTLCDSTQQRPDPAQGSPRIQSRQQEIEDHERQRLSGCPAPRTVDGLLTHLRSNGVQL